VESGTRRSEKRCIQNAVRIEREKERERGGVLHKFTST
jgi:hypothetical protein